jgi:hypothetical protein
VLIDPQLNVSAVVKSAIQGIVDLKTSILSMSAILLTIWNYAKFKCLTVHLDIKVKALTTAASMQRVSSFRIIAWTTMASVIMKR